jgi:hypothetical protein
LGIMESIKTYKAILLSVLGLVIVVVGSFIYIRHHKNTEVEAVVKKQVTTLSGQVTRVYEGENKLVYSMDVPETATSALSMDDALVTVKNDGALFAAVYMTYEGGRGFSSADYLTNVTAKAVPGLAVTGTTTLGGVTWTTAEGGNSEWHVGQVGDGQWLMVVESKKTLHDQVAQMLETLTTK